MSGRADGPQFALGGDTWVLGARIPDCAVYPDLNELNPDATHAVYGSENGVYAPGTGMMNVRFIGASRGVCESTRVGDAPAR